jgi:hypothetical protein
MEDRHASITVDDFEMESFVPENAGLAQGSLLSPTLFGFFNPELVDQPVDYNGGAWRVGPSAEDNLKKIQDADIPLVEAWARRT